MSGNAAPGAMVSLFDGIDYWVTVSKDGYESVTEMRRGSDLENNEQWNFKLKPTTQDLTYDWFLSGPKTHSNESVLVFALSTGDSTRADYSTSYKSSKTRMTLTRGGRQIALYQNGGSNDYLAGQNFTFHIWQYNSTSATYTLKINHSVIYEPIGANTPQSNITQDNRVIAALLFMALIIVSSVIGALVKINGEGVGYEVFAIG